MGCKNKNYKSAQVALNTNTQNVAASGTSLAVLGSQLTDTGCSIDTTSAGFRINASGLYRIRYVFTFTAAAAGTVTAQLFKDGVALACTLVQNTVAADGIYTVAVEAPALVVGTCCNICPTITATVSGVAGTVDYVCASAVRLA